MEALPIVVSVLVLLLTVLLIASHGWWRQQMIIRQTFPSPPSGSLLGGHLKTFTAQRFHRNFAEWAGTYGGVFWMRIVTQMVRSLQCSLQITIPGQSAIGVAERSYALLLMSKFELVIDND